MSPTQFPRPSQLNVPGKWERSYATPESPGEPPARVAASQRRGDSAQRGRQSARARQRPGGRAFVPRPTSLPAQERHDAPLSSHPQHSRKGYLWPAPRSQPAAKRKHVGPRNYRGRSGRPPPANARPPAPQRAIRSGAGRQRVRKPLAKARGWRKATGSFVRAVAK